VKEESLDNLREKIRSRIIPFSVVLEITDRCNLRCLHCYQESAKSETVDLTRLKAVLDDLAELGALKLTLTGGEPTLREEFPEIYDSCHSKGFATTLFTNGTHFDRPLKEALLGNPPLRVECSLYGATPEIHDSITRVGGSFEATLKNIRWMVGEKIPVVVKTVILSLNFGEIRPLEDLCRRLGVTFQRTFRVFPSMDSARSPELLRIPTEELQSILAQEQGAPPGSPESDSPQQGFICNAGRQACCISSDGKVYPCVALRWECGDVKENRFSEIWLRSPILEKLRSYREEDFVDCLHCDLRKRCNFCPGMGFAEHGDMLRPSEETCRLTKADCFGG
jgi:radical SAM protein with 4Fe4S-binding SPASM domain